LKAFFRKKISLVFLCFLQTTLYAIEPRWFEIEIIVFEQSNETRLDSEKWQQQISLPDISNSINFMTPEPYTVNLQQICLQGKFRPVLGMVPVEEIVEADEIIEDMGPMELSDADGISIVQPGDHPVSRKQY